jgi:hypothetical protein
MILTFSITSSTRYFHYVDKKIISEHRGSSPCWIKAVSCVGIYKPNREGPGKTVRISCGHHLEEVPGAMQVRSPVLEGRGTAVHLSDY